MLSTQPGQPRPLSSTIPHYPGSLQFQVKAVAEVHRKVLDEGEKHWLREKGLVKQLVGVDCRTKVYHQLQVRVG